MGITPEIVEFGGHDTLTLREIIIICTFRNTGKIISE